MAKNTPKKPYSSYDTNRDLLSVTAFFSLLLHAVVVLGVTFKMPEIGARNSTDNTLDVVLLNKNNELNVEDADLVSSRDNLGGGDDDRHGETNRDWQKNQSPIETVEMRTDQSLETSVAPDQFIASLDSNVSLPRQAPQETQLRNQQDTRGEDQFNLDQIQRQREQIIARLTQSQEDYRKRPKKKYHSPTTKADGAAEYLDSWRKKVVRVGNANYPIQVRANNLSGSLTISVEIREDGMIHDIKVVTPSKHRELNESALRIVRDASPFEPFPDQAYFKDVDILVITRAIHFLPNNSFSSTAVGRG